MIESLAIEELTAAIRSAPRAYAVGRLKSATGLLSAELPAAIGDLCVVESADKILAEVIGFDGPMAQMMPFKNCTGLPSGAKVVCLARPCQVPAGPDLLGRVINGLGQPIDGKQPLSERHLSKLHRDPPPALLRPRISQPMPTRQRAIDAMNTIGIGQRVGIFAGSGVGKSTLLGEIAKGAETDCCVIALIGERGREVRPFLEDSLGEEGKKRSVTVVATSDETPLMRVRATETAIAIAESLREQGKNVLLMLDSLTRFAMAQREIGLLLGEPPSVRGYTPSVLQKLASLLERLGNSPQGSITALLTVLVDTDEMDDPIGDVVRSIVDGHLVLDRKLAEQGHYPAIRIAASLSRLFPEITDPQHQAAAQKLRAAMAVYETAEDLIRVGAYQPGASPEVDQAVALRPLINQLLRQQPGEFSDWQATMQQLLQTANHWSF